MDLIDIEDKLPRDVYKVFDQTGIKQLRPAQEKAINAGLLEDESLLVCTPTASGKTFVAELAMAKSIVSGKGKAVYIVPLKALASEKYKSFKKRYSSLFKVALSIGDTDASDGYLAEYDLIVCTAEKLDSLIRHHTPWLRYVHCVVVDEIHLLNDPGRGPTLEILITLLKQMLKGMQLIGLSATIGNPYELGEWLGANVVEDSWRPVELKKGVYFDEKVEF